MSIFLKILQHIYGLKLIERDDFSKFFNNNVVIKVFFFFKQIGWRKIRNSLSRFKLKHDSTKVGET